MPVTESSAPSPLSFPDYRFYWVARFTAVMATIAMVVVIGYQLYDTARTDYRMSIEAASLQLGLLGLFQFVPLAVLTPVAGWAADRFERRSVAIFSNLIDITIATTLGWFTYYDGLTLPLLFGLAALHGVARVFSGPAMSAIAPNIVPPAALPRAIAMSSIAWQTGGILGPAFGGLAYAAHPASSYWIAAALLAITTASILSIRPYARTSIKDGSHPLRQMIDGLGYVRGHRFLLGAITLDLFAVLL